MAMAIEDFKVLGKARAQGTLAGARQGEAQYTRQSKSWQARAFWEAYDDEMRAHQWRTKSQPKNVGVQALYINEEMLHDLTAGWPGAAGHHARALATDHNLEKSIKRRQRLHRAVRRMVIRYAGSHLVHATLVGPTLIPQATA